MTLVLFIFVNLVFFCPKMILRIKIEILRNDYFNSLGFYFHNLNPLPKRSVNCNNITCCYHHLLYWYPTGNGQSSKYIKFQYENDFLTTPNTVIVVFFKISFNTMIFLKDQKLKQLQC